jgi:hypothetical protein
MSVSFRPQEGSLARPFAQQQRNEFALGLVREIVPPQNQRTNPDSELRIREQSRVWCNLILYVVRPLRGRQQPLRQRFKDVGRCVAHWPDQSRCTQWDPCKAHVVTITSLGSARIKHRRKMA